MKVGELWQHKKYKEEIVQIKSIFIDCEIDMSEDDFNKKGDWEEFKNNIDLLKLEYVEYEWIDNKERDVIQLEEFVKDFKKYYEETKPIIFKD
jgi:hypothetical protein